MGGGWDCFDCCRNRDCPTVRRLVAFVGRGRYGVCRARAQPTIDLEVSKMGADFAKYLGIVSMAVLLFYVFKDPSGTGSILNSLSNFNSSAIGALQGRNV
jgi:hypothetical protein